MTTTKVQEKLISDLTAFGSISASMVELQNKYAKIQSKASIKRDIDKLVEEGIIKRIHIKKCDKGRITSTTIYQI